MASVRARLLKIPAEPSPELRIPGAAAQTRVVSLAGIRLASWESARAFKGIICDDVSEFESYMPSQPVRLCGASAKRSSCLTFREEPLAADLDRKVLRLARNNAQVRRFMTAPGVGPITALCFVATIDDPSRFKRSRSVGAYAGD